MPADANAKATAADISKLTVAQLKAICKERKIAGYSKLGKPALIQKLAWILAERRTFRRAKYPAGCFKFCVGPSSGYSY